MPALLEDPTSAVLYRTSGDGPYPTAENPQIPASIFPRAVTLRDRLTIATLIPFFSPNDVPKRLLLYLCENLNKEIDGGDTYPMMSLMTLEAFGSYWFGNFGAIMVSGDIGGIEAVNDMEQAGADWSKLCLGSFYVKPNYPGRSSHVCNGGFLVTPPARNKGVGKSMGQCYLDWAPQLGYTYSVFNLVYESNTASTRIWDSLGFKRIGRVPGCGNLRSFPEPVDAIIYGRDLTTEGENVVNEERFDKIRYYLRHAQYPQGADRSEKSRLRSAATHYKLVGGQDGIPDKLFLKDKEVISDPQAQYDIAKQIHLQAKHGGINKITGLIATKYHWVRIKETASHVIKNCPECKDTNKPPVVRSNSKHQAKSKIGNELTQTSMQPQTVPDMNTAQDLRSNPLDPSDFATLHQQVTMGSGLHDTDADLSAYDEMAIDPQIIEQIQAHLASEEYQHHQPFVQPGLPQFADTSHLQQQHDPHGFGPQQTDQFIHDPGTAMMAAHDHVMSNGDDGSGLNGMQAMQPVMHMDYMNTNGHMNTNGQQSYKQ